MIATDMTAYNMLQKALAILEYCQEGAEPFDQSLFKEMVDKFNLHYKRMNYEQQGEYHTLFSEVMTRGW